MNLEDVFKGDAQQQCSLCCKRKCQLKPSENEKCWDKLGQTFIVRLVTCLLQYTFERTVTSVVLRRRRTSQQCLTKLDVQTDTRSFDKNGCYHFFFSSGTSVWQWNVLQKYGMRSCMFKYDVIIHEEHLMLSQIFSHTEPLKRIR